MVPVTSNPFHCFSIAGRPPPGSGERTSCSLTSVACPGVSRAICSCRPEKPVLADGRQRVRIVSVQNDSMGVRHLPGYPNLGSPPVRCHRSFRTNAYHTVRRYPRSFSQPFADVTSRQWRRQRMEIIFYQMYRCYQRVRSGAV